MRLQQVERIQNVGLFQDAIGSPEFSDLTFVYAENGRGKSTFAGLLRASIESDDESVLQKRTIDGAGPQLVRLTTDAGSVVFADNHWQSSMQDTEVFDSEFVRQNVYSGDEIGPAQRQRLLEFCVGAESVRLQRAFNELTAAQTAAQGVVRELTAQIEAVTRGAISVERWVLSVPDPTSSIGLDAARNQLAARQTLDQTLSQPVPETIAELADMQPVFAVLRRDPLSIRAEDLHRVLRHSERTGASVNWLETGVNYLPGEACPFCGQSLDGVELIAILQTYFSEEFRRLSGDLDRSLAAVEDALGDRALDALGLRLQAAQSRVGSWSRLVDVNDLALDSTEAVEELRRLRDELSRMLIVRKNDPAAPVDPIEIARAETIERSARAAIHRFNESIVESRIRIEQARTRLAGESIDQLTSVVSQLEVRELRFLPTSIELVDQYIAAKEAKELVEQQRTAARARLDTSIDATMATYFEATSRILRSFSSSISITSMSHNYTGGRPRIDYALAVRDRQVGVGAHTFGNTFSDGDRRSLALAFFIAKSEVDAEVINRTYFVDDPMSSLDRSRRSTTIDHLSALANRCGQLIVASHDAHFLQEFQDRWMRASAPRAFNAIQIAAVGGGYSAFVDCDIEALCRSEHLERLLKVESYLDNGVPQAELRSVAEAIRPLLEGYLHRRFPSVIRRGTMLGAAINVIQTAPAGSPLNHLEPSVQRMQSLTAYANQFHHDTNPNAHNAVVDDGEVRAHVTSLMDLMYSGELL